MFTSLTDACIEFRLLPDMRPVVRPGVMVATPTARGLDLLAGYLTARGFAVWTAESGVHALDVYVRNLGGIEAVVIDAALPDLPGMAFVARFRRHFPGVPVCVLTEDPYGPQADDLIAAGATVVAKPVHLRHLVETLWSELAVPALS